MRLVQFLLQCIVWLNACTLVPGVEEKEEWEVSVFVKAEAFCQLSCFLISYLCILEQFLKLILWNIQILASWNNFSSKYLHQQIFEISKYLDNKSQSYSMSLCKWYCMVCLLKFMKRLALKNVVISEPGAAWNQFRIKKVGAGFYLAALSLAARLVKGWQSGQETSISDANLTSSNAASSSSSINYNYYYYYNIFHVFHLASF